MRSGFAVADAGRHARPYADDGAPDVGQPHPGRSHGRMAPGMVNATLERWLTAEFREAHPETVETIEMLSGGAPVEGYVGVAQPSWPSTSRKHIGQIHCRVGDRGRKRPGCARFDGATQCQQDPRCEARVLPEAAPPCLHRAAGTLFRGVRCVPRQCGLWRSMRRAVVRAERLLEYRTARRSRNLRAAPMPNLGEAAIGTPGFVRQQNLNYGRLPSA